MRNVIYGFRDEFMSGTEDKVIEERKVKLLHQKVWSVPRVSRCFNDLH